MAEVQSAKSAKTMEPSPLNQDREPAAARNLSSIIEMQTRAAGAAGEVAGLATQAAKDLAERQSDYFRTGQELFRNAVAAGGDGEPAERFARQAELYREFMETSVKHMTGLLEIVSTSCCDAVDRMTRVGAGVAGSSDEKSTS